MFTVTGTNEYVIIMSLIYGGSSSLSSQSLRTSQHESCQLYKFPHFQPMVVHGFSVQQLSFGNPVSFPQLNSEIIFLLHVIYRLNYSCVLYLFIKFSIVRT